MRATNGREKNTMDVQFSILCLLCLAPAATTAVTTFRVEAETVSRLQHRITNRNQASNGQTVSFQTTKERLSFPFCLYSQSSDASITVHYFNTRGRDTITLKAGDTSSLTFKSELGGDGASRSKVFRPHSLKRGYNLFTLTFKTLDSGIEIDRVDITVSDDFMTEDVFSCRLVTAGKPRLSSGSHTVVMKQYTSNTTRSQCPEEDNIHLPVYHPAGSISQYTLTASRPLYRSMRDSRTSDDSMYVFWRFEDVAVIEDKNRSWAPSSPVPNLHHAVLTGSLLKRANVGTAYVVAYTVSFNRKACGMDTRKNVELKAEFCRAEGNSPSSALTHVSHVNGQGQATTLDTFTLDSTKESSRRRQWTLAGETGSEANMTSSITVKMSDKTWTLCSLELVRSNPALELYSDDALLLQGWRTDVWGGGPVKNLTVTVGTESTTALLFVALSVHVPWAGAFRKIMLLYQDGSVHLAPMPHNAPYPHPWTAFGTSVIVGRSNSADLRPAASIRHLTFYPDTLQMALSYYDGSSCKLTLTYSGTETKLKVTDLTFPQANSDLPFATFRTQFVRFNTTFSDSVQSDMDGPRHVRGTWNKLNGSEFLVFRSVESCHRTHSPDIRLSV